MLDPAHHLRRLIRRGRASSRRGAASPPPASPPRRCLFSITSTSTHLGPGHLNFNKSWDNLVVVAGVQSSVPHPGTSVSLRSPESATGRVAWRLEITGHSGSVPATTRWGPSAKLTSGLLTKKTSASRASPAPFSRRLDVTARDIGTHVKSSGWSERESSSLHGASLPIP